MQTVQFLGRTCEQVLADAWAQRICAHLRPLFRHASGETPLSLRNMFATCSRSAEVFLLVDAASADFANIPSSGIIPPLIRSNGVISCSACWIDVYTVNDPRAKDLLSIQNQSDLPANRSTIPISGIADDVQVADSGGTDSCGP